MNAVVFDLGDTLVEYEGVPLNWEAHYPEAFSNLLAFLNRRADDGKIVHACSVLRRYNTRVHPREQEFPFSVILRELLSCLDIPVADPDIPACATAFFRIFRQRLRCFPETKGVLERLRKNHAGIGVFTDVPYGMPRELVVEDIREAGLENSFDLLLTSHDVGYRKPSVKTLAAVAQKLNCPAEELVHVGNEKKDIEVARTFGCRSILVDRHRHGSHWGQDRTIASLSEL